MLPNQPKRPDLENQVFGIQLRSDLCLGKPPFTRGNPKEDRDSFYYQVELLHDGKNPLISHIGSLGCIYIWWLVDEEESRNVYPGENFIVLQITKDDEVTHVVIQEGEKVIKNGDGQDTTMIGVWLDLFIISATTGEPVPYSFLMEEYDSTKTMAPTETVN